MLAASAPVPEPSLSHRLFAKRAAIASMRAAEWASTALTVPADTAEPVHMETALRFSEELGYLLDIVVRDAISCAAGPGPDASPPDAAGLAAHGEAASAIQDMYLLQVARARELGAAAAGSGLGHCHNPFGHDAGTRPLAEAWALGIIATGASAGRAS